MKLDLASSLSSMELPDELKGVSLSLLLSVIALGINLLAYLLLVPDLEAQAVSAESTLVSLNDEVSQQERTIGDLRAKVNNLPEYLDSYSKREKDGVFDPEDRLRANVILDEIRSESGALEYHLDMKPRAPFSFSSKGKNFTWQASAVTVYFEAPYDRPFFAFSSRVLGSLNGHSLFKSMKMERSVKEPLTRNTVDKMKKEGLIGLMSGEMSFLWVTLTDVDSPRTDAQKP